MRTLLSGDAVFETCYSNVGFDRNSLNGFRYAIAEVEVRGGRRHRRIIGDNPSDPFLNGRPLFYSDTYVAADSPVTYVYARHKSDPSLFFSALNFFLEEHTSSEFSAWHYKAMVNVGSELGNL